MDRERLALCAGLGRQLSQIGKACDEFGAAIGIAAVIERIDADKNIARAQRFGPGQRERQEHQIARRYVSYRNIGADPPLGHRHIAG